MKRLSLLIAGALLALSLAPAQAQLQSRDDTSNVPGVFGVTTATGRSVTVQPTIAVDASGLAAPGRVGTVTDGSGLIAAGGGTQQVFAANPSRSYLSCQNPITATETLFINIGAAASTTGGSFELPPGGSFTPTGVTLTGSINLTAATTGHRFICKQG